ncbi:bacterial proteasome activator family protein [Nocardia sp. NPDC050713]|uniref:bacterial proteasome activator family protein n=1 Tax=unclassified Nocardia TaxID=2637762 RepID=UPI0033A6D0C1
MTHSDESPDSIVVVGPDGQPLVIPADAGTPLTGQVVTDSDKKTDGSDDRDDSGESLADMVEQPAKVMRIGTMIKQLLEEVRAAPLDDASRTRLREIHKSSVRELEQGLAPELRDELERLTLPFTDDAVPSDAELRIAQAQLVGWLEGLFHGIQTALFAQQMAARAQLEQMRQGALPPGIHTVDPRGGRGDQSMGGSGQYL